MASAAASPAPQPLDAARPSFAALPCAVIACFLALLPVDARARCAVVCPAWRDAAAERSLWRALDLSWRGGVSARALTPALLRGAAAKARGALVSLDVTDRELPYVAVFAIIQQNRAALRELRLAHWERGHDVADLRNLLATAPQLTLLEVDADMTLASLLHELLPAAAHAVPLRLRRLSVRGDGDEEEDRGARDASVLLALAHALATRVPHVTPRELLLYGIALDTPAVMDALLDAAASAGVGAPFRSNFWRL
jgi:hypothetical protein